MTTPRGKDRLPRSGVRARRASDTYELLIDANGGLTDAYSGLAINLASGSVLVLASNELDVTIGTGVQNDGGTLKSKDSEIVHDNLSGFVADEHIDHTTVTMTAGTGLSGGGTIAATRTFTTNDAEIVHDNLSGFVANEHIDWTDTTEDFKTTGTVTAGAATFGDGGTTHYLSISATGDVAFNGTAHLDWTKITANGATIRNAHGTTGSSVNDLKTAHDGNFYTLSEEGAETPGMDVEIDFTGVTAFHWVQILGRYEQATTAHGITIMLEITPFNGTAWHRYDFMLDQPADLTNEEHSFFVPDSSAYINGGVVKVRFVHEMAGTSANHDLVLDTVALYH